MDAAIVALVAGAGWGSGLNLYLVTVALGVAGRFDLVAVPELLQRTDVLVVAGLLLIVEFVVDKIPGLDSLWDTVHTVVRPVGAAALGAVLSGEADTVLAALVAGGLATSSHVTKATLRATVNTSPEPFSNLALSVGEDGLVLGMLALAVTAPLLAVVVVVALVIVGGALTGFLLSRARRGLRRLRARRAARRAARGSAGRDGPGGPGGPGDRDAPSGPGND